MKTHRLIKKEWLILILSICIFIFAFLDYLFFNLLFKYDSVINNFFTDSRNIFILKVFMILTAIGDYKIMIILALVLSLILLYYENKRNLALLLSGLILGLIAEFLLKIVIHRPRPLNGIIVESTYSFPSAHATMSTIFFLSLLYSFKDSFKDKFWKSIFVAVCILFFLLVSFSRIYLGVHWFSDVIAGVALGVAVVFSVRLILEKIKIF